MDFKLKLFLPIWNYFFAQLLNYAPVNVISTEVEIQIIKLSIYVLNLFHSHKLIDVETILTHWYLPSRVPCILCSDKYSWTIKYINDVDKERQIHMDYLKMEMGRHIRLNTYWILFRFYPCSSKEKLHLPSASPELSQEHKQ